MKIEIKLTTYLLFLYYLFSFQMFAPQDAWGKETFPLKHGKRTNFFSPCWPPYWKFSLVVHIAGATCVAKVSLSLPRSRQSPSKGRKSCDSSVYKIRLVCYANFISVGFPCRKYLTNQRYHNLTRNIQHIVVIMFLTNLKFTVISDAILCQTISDQVWTIF